jgi:hypothetical protein
LFLLCGVSHPEWQTVALDSKASEKGFDLEVLVVDGASQEIVSRALHER